jgi:hypothetical protein
MAPENELTDRSMIDLPPVLSPSSILHPPSSHCIFILARKNLAIVLKTLRKSESA